MALTGKEQYQRVAILQAINAQGLTKTFSGLRTKFKAEQTSESMPNTATIEIYNLNKESRTFLESEKVRIKFEVGYISGSEQILAGNITKCVSMRQTPDWLTVIEMGEGQKELKESHIEKSWAPGTPFQAIFSQALGALGVSVGPSLLAIPDIAAEGFSFSGPVKSLLDMLGKRFGVEWGVQNGTVQATTISQPVPGTAVLVSSTTGLIGNVQKKEKGIEFTNLINSALLPGRLVNVQSLDVTGFYKIRKVITQGDTHGDEWFKHIEAEVIG